MTVVRARTLTALATAAAVALGSAGCGAGSGQNPLALGGLINTDSVWVPGQASLLSFNAYRSIADRAEALAADRTARRDLELARIAEELKAAEKRAAAEALRKYEEAKRQAELAYKRALREAARQRRLNARRLAAAERKRQRELAALRRKLQVKPGQECTLPEVAQYFQCRKGMTPLPKPLPTH